MLQLLLQCLHSVTLLLSYIANGNSFPKPLDPKEEQKYLLRSLEGDIEARNILIEHNLRLVAHIVKKYSGSVRDHEDLISIGTIGLIKGISSFNPACNLCGAVRGKRNFDAAAVKKERAGRCFAQRDHRNR